ncbi:MAG: glutaminase A [Thermomicrobiales bacterium]
MREEAWREETLESTPVSTGRLPLPASVQRLLYSAHERYRSIEAGEVSRVYPALTRAPREHFGIALMSAEGASYAVGEADVSFTIMSVSKPFVFALVCQQLGVEESRTKLGVNSTGLPFNSVMAIELNDSRLTNPMVNSGALATTSLAPGHSPDEKWSFIHAGLSAFAGRTLLVNEEVYASAVATNHRNRGIASLLHGYDRLYDDPIVTTDLYTRQCSIDITARDLAVMGATLANGGVNPQTGIRVVDAGVCGPVLAVMATAGMYETSGDWLYDVGLPGKSGIGGGVVAVSPGKGGVGVFSPPLDAAGNSVRGQLAVRYLSRELGLSLFASAPSVRTIGTEEEAR